MTERRSAPRVVLIGPMGAGKTTVAGLLADAWGLPVRDTDADIEAAEGRSVSDIFVESGEAHFRALEAVAVASDVRRQGLASAVMDSLEGLAPGYDLLALSASDAGVPLYEARGWDLWRGPSSVATTVGVVPTPDDDGSLYVRGTGLRLDAPITCDWREGDVW